MARVNGGMLTAVCGVTTVDAALGSPTLGSLGTAATDGRETAATIGCAAATHTGLREGGIVTAYRCSGVAAPVKSP
jgi:hypothetical protein